MKKDFFIIMSICLLIITGCSFRKVIKENKREDEYKIQAKNEAIRYINNKYGISLNDGNIKNVYLEKKFVDEWDYDPNGNATITAIYNNKEFKIYVNYLKKNMNSYIDGYEKDIIFESIQNYYYKKIGLNVNNSKLYLGFDLEMHDKFIDVNTLFSNMNSDINRFVAIITTGKINNDDLEKIAKEYDIFNLYVYKLNDSDDLNGFRKDAVISKDYAFLENELFSSHSRLHIEDKYQYEVGGHYYHINYSIVSLENGIYVKSDNKDSISIKKVNDKEIKQYQDKINECGNDLTILGVYGVSTTISKKDYFGKYLYIYNMNKESNNDFNKYEVYPIIINDEVECEKYSNESLMRIKSSTSYVAIVSIK